MPEVDLESSVGGRFFSFYIWLFIIKMKMRFMNLERPILSRQMENLVNCDDFLESFSILKWILAWRH